jgi:tetratricopeptide (TPR) repeat protein
MPKLTTLTLIILTLAVGCRKEVLPDEIDYVDYGWILMAELDYRGAIENFNLGIAEDATYADANNGLGWAYIKLGEADSASIKFELATADTSEVGTEIYAGRAFTKLALDEYTVAVTNARTALTQDPLWIFEHDTSILYEHLYLVGAIGYFSLAEYDSCLVWIQKIEDLFDVEDLTRTAAPAELADKLAELNSALLF